MSFELRLNRNGGQITLARKSNEGVPATDRGNERLANQEDEIQIRKNVSVQL